MEQNKNTNATLMNELSEIKVAISDGIRKLIDVSARANIEVVAAEARFYKALQEVKDARAVEKEVNDVIYDINAETEEAIERIENNGEDMFVSDVIRKYDTEIEEDDEDDEDDEVEYEDDKADDEEVECQYCHSILPKSEAIETADGYFCSDECREEYKAHSDEWSE